MCTSGMPLPKSSHSYTLWFAQGLHLILVCPFILKILLCCIRWQLLFEEPSIKMSTFQCKWYTMCHCVYVLTCMTFKISVPSTLLHTHTPVIFGNFHSYPLCIKCIFQVKLKLNLPSHIMRRENKIMHLKCKTSCLGRQVTRGVTFTET